MNQLIAKKASILSLILGAALGIVALIPPAIGFIIFILGFLVSVIVIIYMKKNEKLGIIDNEQGAILGAISGFCAGVGFFASFAPMVLILKLILKDIYYSYAIPYMINDAFWLFVIIVFMVSVIFALTNSATGMGIAFIYGKAEEKPKDYDAPLDIKIED